MDVLNYSSYPKALSALADKLKKRKFSFDEYHIVLTPDRYTLQVERTLFLGGGAIDCEVLTLSRLCRRVCGRSKTLSREGGVMLTSRAASGLNGLEYYQSAVQYPEFARDVYEALLQIGSSAVDIQELALAVSENGGGGVTGKKLRDLAKIKEAYDELKGGALDSPDRLKVLMSAAGTSELIKKSHFYAIGYSDATELIGQVFAAISQEAKSFELYASSPPSEPHAVGIKIFQAADAISQYKEAAALIRNYVYNGGRYGDVSVVAPDPRALTRILNEYGVEYYADTSVALYDTAPFSALANVIKLSVEPESDRVIALCKNPYSSVDPSDADELEFVLVSRGIKFNVFSADISEYGAKRALSRIKNIIDVFTAQSDFSKSCSAVIEYCDFEEIERDIARKANALSGDSGLAMTDAVNPIRSLLELIDSYGTDDNKRNSLMFFSAAKSLEVKSLPRFTDRVTVVGAESLRLTACKKLIVVDFNEGILPVPTADSGLIADADIVASGGKIKPSAKEKNKRSREELLSVIYNADDVVCMYYEAGKTKKAALLSALGGIKFEHSGKIEDIAYRACVPSAARELVARKQVPYPSAVEGALFGTRFAEKIASPFESSVPSDVVRHDTLSVSELTNWFYCPYRRFLHDTVGLADRKNGELSAPDFGTIMHKFMERFIVDKLYKLPGDILTEKAEECALSVIQDINLNLSDVDKARIVGNARDYALTNAKIIRAGEYEPNGGLVEYRFCGDFKLGKAQIPFKGTIDRIDEKTNDKNTVRLVDYKTNVNKEFSSSKCKNGREMQLPLYAAELKRQGKTVTGMFYIPLPPKTKSDKPLLAGKMIKDVGTATDYDGEIPSGAKSTVLGAQYNPQTGKFKKSAQLIEQKDFDELIDLSVRTASLAADEIESGYIERSPAGGACDYCPYLGLCEEKFPRTDKVADGAASVTEGER